MLLVPLFASSFYAPIAILARGRSPAVQASTSAIEAPTTTSGAAAADPIQVWDGVFGEEALQTLLEAGEQRGHGFTAVFDRGEDATLRGRTIIECSLTALLDEIGDRSRFVEYWWRAEHISMRAHRDVDEAVCRSQKRGAAGVQLCPENGHVLYLDVGADVRGPTCVWEEHRDGLTDRGGAPRSLTELHVVPVRAARLLRFRGDMLHAVPKPACEWMETGGDPVTADDRRCVMLFNTWDVPPTLPPPDAPASPKAVDGLKALGFTPGCLPREAWTKVESAVGSTEEQARSVRLGAQPIGEIVDFAAPLLGDQVRRGCASESLASRAPEAALRRALLAAETVSCIPLEAMEASATSTLKSQSGGVAHQEEAAVVEDEAEKLAMMAGFAEHLEADFWGVDDDGDDDDDEYW